jgi:hypothetical protein
MIRQSRLAFDEVMRNLGSARRRTASLALVSVLIGATVALLTIVDMERISAINEQQYEAGSSAFQVVAPGGARADAVRCNAIQGITGVLAAGGIISADNVRLGVQPDADVSLLTVTPGFVAAAWPGLKSASGVSALAGSAYTALSWHRNTRVTYTNADGSPTVIRLDAVPSSRSMLGLDRVIIAVVPPATTVDTCLVLADPPARSAVAAAVRGWFGEGTSVQDVLVGSALVENPQALLDNRLSRFGWLAGGAAIALLLLGSWVARRAEFALYRLLGFRESGVLAMFVAEMALLALVPIQVGALVAIGSRHLEPLVASAFWLDWLRLDLLVIMIPLLGLAIVPRRSLLATLKGF